MSSDRRIRKKPWTIDQILGKWNENLSQKQISVEEIDRNILEVYQGAQFLPAKSRTRSDLWEIFAQINFPTQEGNKQLNVCRWCLNQYSQGKGTSNFITHLSTCLLTKGYQHARRYSIAPLSNSSSNRAFQFSPHNISQFGFPRSTEASTVRIYRTSASHSLRESPYAGNDTTGDCLQAQTPQQTPADCRRNLFPSTAPQHGRSKTYFTPPTSQTTPPMSSSTGSNSSASIPNIQSTYNRNSNSQYMSPESFKHLVADFIASVGLPYNLVEHHGFKSFITNLVPQYASFIPSRSSVRRIIEKRHKEMIADMKSLMSKYCRHSPHNEIQYPTICIGIDGWEGTGPHKYLVILLFFFSWMDNDISFPLNSHTQN